MSCNIAVTVAGKGVVYPCVYGMTIGWAIDHIRERYEITGGSIDCDGVGADEGNLIESERVYSFVGGSVRAVAPSVVPLALSTDTLTQVSHVKVNGDYYFPRFDGEFPVNTVFKSAWEFNSGEWRPRVIKMACMNEKWHTLNMHRHFPGRKLEEFHLVDANLWGNPRGPLQSGVTLPRYAGVLAEFTATSGSITASPVLVLKQLSQISIALQTLHSIGVVHCDVKPSNVFLDGSCNAFLGDFGSMLPFNERVDSRTPGYCMTEHLAERLPAAAVMDWAALVLTGLQLVRRIVIDEHPVSSTALSSCIDGMRAHTEPAHRKIVDIYDTYLSTM